MAEKDGRGGSVGRARSLVRKRDEHGGVARDEDIYGGGDGVEGVGAGGVGRGEDVQPLDCRLRSRWSQCALDRQKRLRYEWRINKSKVPSLFLN